MILCYSLCHIFYFGLFSAEHIWETGASDKVGGLAGCLGVSLAGG